MTPHSRSNLVLGLVSMAIASGVAFIWVPLDVETGLIENVRRRVVIGDALAPTLAAFFIGLGGAALILFERKAPGQPDLRPSHLTFMGALVAVLVVGFLIMLNAGPIAVSLFGGDSDYRLLRDTAPWKYIGYLLGGIFIISALITQAEGRFSLRSILISTGVVTVLIVLYDLPFDDLLLPPNGDV